MRRRHSRNSFTELMPIVRLWTLRILITLKGHRSFIRSHGFSDDSLALTLGLERWVEDPEFVHKVKDSLTEVRQLHRQAEMDCQSTHVPAALTRNIERLQALTGLTEVDRQVLAFVVLLRNDSTLSAAARCVEKLTMVDACESLAIILDLPVDDIRASLHRDGALLRSGLISITTSPCDIEDKFQPISDDFAGKLMLPDMEPADLLRSVVTPAAPAELSLDDYPHLAPSLDILVPYLRHAIDAGCRGVNVFLHGPPGTGKTQLARAVAARLGCTIFEISSEDDDGDPQGGKKRLCGLRAAQCFFRSSGSLVLFDEVEDVFAGDFFGKSVAQANKGWMNQMLEGNGTPTFWLSNSIQGIDAAFMRRFDLVLEVGVPPRRQRERTVRSLCGDLVEEASILRLADSETLAPAVVARAVNVVRAIEGGLDRRQASVATERLIDNILSAQGHASLRANEATRLPPSYDPAYINVDADLTQIAAGLAQSRCGRLCLYGPPGTGKTAYGRWLAQQLGMPLMLKRASDLLSMWVGQAEKNIAAAFRSAESDGAILLIDEVDSFLQDRSGAQRSWEITQVNEMLTQMEAFPGIFIASTNLMSGLDQAALRRFDLKLKFDFLKPAQAAAMLYRHCEALEIPAPHAAEELARKRLRSLTPGDFAAVMRRHRFHPVTNTEDLVAALQAECAIKADARAPIGFVH